jgi:hypothetical protein
MHGTTVKMYYRIWDILLMWCCEELWHILWCLGWIFMLWVMRLKYFFSSQLFSPRHFVMKTEVCSGDVGRSKAWALMPSFNIESNVSIYITYQHCWLCFIVISQLHTGFGCCLLSTVVGKCDYCITWNYMMVAVPDLSWSLQTNVKQRKNCMVVFAFEHCVSKIVTLKSVSKFRTVARNWFSYVVLGFWVYLQLESGVSWTVVEFEML